MILILENKDNISTWIRNNYFIDLEEEYSDVQILKNKVFTSELYHDAKRHLSPGTFGKYKSFISSCGNNRKKMIKNGILSFGRALYNKKYGEKKC